MIIPGTTARHRPAAPGGGWRGADGVPGGYAPPVAPDAPPYPARDSGPPVPERAGTGGRPDGQGQDQPGPVIGGEPRWMAAPATPATRHERRGMAAPAIPTTGDALPQTHARPASPDLLSPDAPLPRRDGGSAQASSAVVPAHRARAATGTKPFTVEVPVSAREDGEARGAQRSPAEPAHEPQRSTKEAGTPRWMVRAQRPTNLPHAADDLPGAAEPPRRRAASRPPPASEESWVRPPEPPAPPPQITVVATATTAAVVTHAFWERAYLSRLRARILR